MEREPAARITIDKQGGCVAFSTASAFLQFPPDAVSEPVTLTCSRVRYKDCDVKAKWGDAFCSRILKIEPEGIAFAKPVTVLLAHSAAEDGADADYYDLVVQRLNVECEDLKTERISKYEDLPEEIVSDFSHFIKYLPFAKATIVKTCTLVVASRIRSEEIVIQQKEACIYSKSYGDESKLKITFPAGVVENESRLRVQLFPADEVLDTNTWLNEDLVCFPVIKVSGQEKPFLKLVDVELIYSHDDVADLNETFFPVGAKFPFSTKYGVLLRSHKDPQAKHEWKNVKDDVNAEIERLLKNRLRITFSVDHFCEIETIVKKNEEANLGNVEENIDCEHSSPKSYKAIVLAVHDTNVRPNMLSAVLAPKTEVENVERERGSKGEVFQKRLRSNEEVYFCVPLSDQEHLSLPDNVVRFLPDEITRMHNKTEGGINLGDKDKHFLLQPCEGRNHSGRNCYVKARIQPRMKPKTTSGNQILATTPGISSCLVDDSRCSYTFSTDENQTKREIDEKTFHLVKARSLALQFMAANPTCVRAIPYSEDDNNKRITMFLYMHTGCKGITAALRKRATGMLVGYTLEFVDLERRPLVENVVLLPSNEKTKTEELSKLAEIIDENLGVFENRLNVTAVQPSYRIVNAQETSDLCVTVFVLGKGKIPVGESDFSEVEQLSGYPYDIVEGYGIPTSSPFRSKAFPLRSGVGIGVEDQREGTGTLGAFVVDEDDKCYILSCEHVLRPDLPGISDNIVQPSEEDHRENVKQLNDDITQAKKELKKYENRKLGSVNEKESVESDKRVKEYEEQLELKKSEKGYNVRYKMPRKIAKYRCGVRGNVRKEIYTNVTKEFWVDAAVADLDPKEEEEIRVGGFPDEMPKIDEIISMRNFGKEHNDKIRFMKYGRTTGYTDLGELQEAHFHENRAGFKAETCFGIFTNAHFETYCTRCSSKMDGQIIETSKVGIDKITCAKCKIEFPKPEEIGELWARNRFTIQKKKKLFSDEGDSGALVYDEHCKLRGKHDKHDEHCLVNRAWGIITGMFDTCNSYLSIAISLEVALEALAEELGKTGETGKTLRLWCPEET